MNRPMLGLALGNGRSQDELCDALAQRMQVERCRTDRELLALIAQHLVGGAIVGQDLLGLDRHVLPALARRELPTVLLVTDRDVRRRRTQVDSSRVRVLPLGATPDAIAAAVEELFGVRPRREQAGPSILDVRRPTSTPRSTRGRVYAFVGSGGTGCTTVVANVLVALGAERAVVGVDLDPVAPLLVPLLDGDPSRGLDGMIRAQEAGVASLERALEANLQPLADGLHAPQALLLGGLPLNGDRRVGLSPDLAEGVLALLADRGAIVLVDIGRLLPLTDRLGVVQRAALLAADGIIVVSAGDRPGVLRTCDSVAHLLGTAPHPELDRLALVINDHHSPTMDPPSEIAASIGLPLAACVAADEAAMRRAVHDHQPSVNGKTTAATRELLGLAEALATSAWPPRFSVRPAWHVRLWMRSRRALAALRAGAWMPHQPEKVPVLQGGTVAQPSDRTHRPRVKGARKPSAVTSQATVGTTGATERRKASMAASTEVGS